MPFRRAVVAFCLSGLAGLAGCSGLSAGNGTERGSTASQTQTEETDADSSPPDRPSIDCDRARRPDPEADEADAVEAIAYPDPPGARADALEWAAEHERAYVRNQQLAEHDVEQWHGLGVRESETRDHRSGTVVRVAYTYGMLADGIFVDSALETAAYYVDDRGALRAHAAGGAGELASDVDPVADGRPVVCF